MPHLNIRVPSELRAGFARIREEFDVTGTFPEAALAEAAGASDGFGERVDHREVPFVAIDPEGATDLDQAFHATATDRGFAVRYAIADVGAFVDPGAAVDAEAMERGATMYCPDGRSPLHPPVLSEDRASLLPGSERPALVWTFELDRDGAVVSSFLERSRVVVAAAISYAEAQTLIDAGTSGPLEVLRRVGLLRQEIEADRGGVSIAVPTQEVVRSDGGYRLAFEHVVPVEQWNAQISLMAGMEAALVMVEAGSGILRTLPDPEPSALRRLRTEARVLGLDWPEGSTYAQFVRTLSGTEPASAAFLNQAVRLLRGAGYHVLEKGGEAPEHGAIAALYAHVTAPIRRLVDRFANEILVAVFAGDAPPAWALERLEELPSVMARAGRRQGGIDRAAVELVEAVVLERHVGSRFGGHVVDVRNDRAVVQLDDLPVVVDVEAPIGGAPALAQPVMLVLEAVDVSERRTLFSFADAP